MKTRPNQAIRQLRQIMGATQAELAAMIGAAKDTVVSWELGRNRLSRQFAGRLSFATGVAAEALLRGRGPLTARDPLAKRRPFTAETFAEHRRTQWGRSDEAAARQHFRNCADALRILFQAAVWPTRGQNRPQLPAVLESFRQWCEATRVDFQLDEGIQAQLAQRRFKLGQTRPYGEWRRRHKGSPAAFEAAGYQDDPSKGDAEGLFVGREAVPAWTPGACMRGPIPGQTRVLPRS
jgi:DNA-binding XRE family transcriptional regulator